MPMRAGSPTSAKTVAPPTAAQLDRANTNVPERIAMEWLGHVDNELASHSYHLNDEVSCCKVDPLNLLGEDN